MAVSGFVFKLTWMRRGFSEYIACANSEPKFHQYTPCFRHLILLSSDANFMRCALLAAGSIFVLPAVEEVLRP